MTPIFVFVEDRLSDAVVRKLLRESANPFNVSGRVTNGCDIIKKKIKGINESAQGMPFMVLVDLDTEECAPALISKWLPEPKNPNLIFRVAVREVESWVMADIDGFSRFLGIKSSLFPFDMDSIDDPKQFLIQIAGKSRKKELRKAIVPKPGINARVGPDYNGVLTGFVYSDWDIARAIQRSKSLKHAVDAIDNFRWLQ
jgi:hypothetical protein